jgi:YqaJ-like viral recombinase domain
MPKLYFDIKQGTTEWYEKRSRIPTASEFHHVITPAKLALSTQRFKYGARIVAARLLNWQADSLDKIAHIKEGKEKEPLAIAQMELLYDIETRAIGFVTTDNERFGASPDRVVMSGDTVAITAEAKCPTIPIQMERVLFGHGADYACQVNGQLWITEADKAIFLSFHERFPRPYVVETGRDEATIGKIRAALEQFNEELEEWTELAARLGMYQAFETILPPLDAALAENDEDALARMADGYS